MSGHIMTSFIFLLIFGFSDGKTKTNPTLDSLRSVTIECDVVYVSDCAIEIKSYNSSSTRVLSISLNLLKDWSSNVSMQFKLLQWKNDSYKQSFLNYERSVCFLLENEKWIFPLIRRFSNLPKSCPIPVGFLNVTNLGARENFMPANVPPNKYRFSIKIISETLNRWIMKLIVDIELLKPILKF